MVIRTRSEKKLPTLSFVFPATPRIKATPHPPKFRFTWNDTGVMLGTLLLSTGMGFLFHSAGFSESNIITVYILGVLLTAVWTSGYFYGALASFLSVAAFNFFFTGAGGLG